MGVKWIYDSKNIDWEGLSELYRIAPLGEKKPEDLKKSFTNSLFNCFLLDDVKIVGAGRALADGVDCSYICDVAVHPDYQGLGLGKEIIVKLRDFSFGHKKIILYSTPGKENFYKKLGFKRMSTAMAIFDDQAEATELGLVDDS